MDTDLKILSIEIFFDESVPKLRPHLGLDFQDKMHLIKNKKTLT